MPRTSWGATTGTVAPPSIMLVAAGASLVLFLSVPLAALGGLLSLGLLLGVALLTGTAAVFFQTAYTAYLPGVLDPADQSEGNAKLHGGASAAQIAGLGSGGLFAQAAGAVNRTLVNAATFAVPLLCLRGIGYREPARVRSAGRGGAMAREVVEGLRLVAHDWWLRTLTLFGACSNLALMGYQSLQVLFLVREAGAGSGTAGLLIAAAGTGGVVGALVGRRAARRFGSARATLLCELGLPVGALFIPLTFDGPGLLLFVPGGFSVSAGVVGGNVVKAGFQQRYCPPRLLGRLTASTAFLNYGTIPLGALLGGTLGTVLGVRPALWIMTAGVPLSALALLFSPVRRVRELPTAPGACASLSAEATGAR
ncbi:MFS transporter [Streptomyces sp. NPDC007088]|uniref:MFS transporter n=1 Tax=Streptomyces sp. NPDC007088 TaxID=3364773 RepID=UPI00367A72AD